MRILVLSPHGDDAELGAGASIHRFIREGYEVFVHLLATKEKFPDDFPIKDRLDEFESSMKILGVTKHSTGSYPVRELPDHRQEILEELVALRKDIQPDIVMIPSLNDMHQDHMAVAMEGFRAFNRYADILAYEIPWNTVGFNPAHFISVNKEDIDVKVNALQSYESQRILGRNYIDAEFVKAQVRFRGAQCGCVYAEAFEVLKSMR